MIAPLPDAAAARSLARLRPALAEDAHRVLPHGDAVGFLARLDLVVLRRPRADQPSLRRAVRRAGRAPPSGSRWRPRRRAPPICATSTGVARSTRAGTSTSGWSATWPTPTGSQARWRSCRGCPIHLAELGVTYLHLMPCSKRAGEKTAATRGRLPRVDPGLGSMEDLAALATELRRRGMSLRRLVLNHTAGEHPWARGWRRGNQNTPTSNVPRPPMPDAYEATVRRCSPTRRQGRSPGSRRRPGLGVDHVPPLSVGPQLRQPAVFAAWSRRSCVSPTRASRSSASMRCPSCGSASAPGNNQPEAH